LCLIKRKSEDTTLVLQSLDVQSIYMHNMVDL
jgi:hypothetical protein